LLAQSWISLSTSTTVPRGKTPKSGGVASVEGWRGEASVCEHSLVGAVDRILRVFADVVMHPQSLLNYGILKSKSAIEDK